MSDLEKDLEMTEENPIDADLDGFGNLEDFVDLEDLSDLSAEDVLADMDELGDISDLGDLSDVNDLSILEEEPVMTESADANADIDELLSDLLPDADVDMGIDSDLDMDMGMDSDLDMEMDSEIDMDMDTIMDDSMEISEPELDVSDLFKTTEPEALEEEMFIEDVPVPEDIALSEDVISDLEEAAGLMETDTEEIEPVLPEEMVEPVTLEEFAEPILPDMKTEEDALDEMLGGILDDLDANGLLDMEQSESPDEIKEEPPEEEGGLDDLMSILTAGGEEEEIQQDIIGLEDVLTEDTQESLIPETVEKEPEKPGLLKRLFGNVVTDEIAEKELAAREAEKEAEAQKAEEDAKAKEEAEAAKALKAEEKAAKKAEKAEEKALKKAAKAEEKAAKKAEKAARKAQEEAEAELEVVGKLNKVGVSIIVVCTALFLAAEISGTKLFSYHSTLNQAKDYFEMQRYTQAYQEILGTDMKEKDQETYDRLLLL